MKRAFTLIELLEKDVTLAPYTAYKIGGPADYFFKASSASDLVEAVENARKNHLPYFILGQGANILIGDKGFRGLVILNRANNIRFSANLVTAESGVTIAGLITKCTQKGLSGLEHFAGIPSSVGGAMRQNLHFLAPDRQNTIYIESVVKAAFIYTEQGQKKMVDKSYFKFGYDESILHHLKDIVLEVTFKLQPKPKAEIEAQIKANLEWRNAKQPQLAQFPSCGSVFKKIEGVGAGRLIDKVGLKGKRIGGAQISEKHANYIINLGGASAADVRALISLAQKEVKDKLGYTLEPEVQFVGEF